MGIAAPGPRDLCGNRTGKDDFPCARPARKRMAELTAKGIACELFDMAGDTLYGRCRTADGADLARALGMDDERCDMVRACAPLHDVGKIGIPDSVLLKPGKDRKSVV